MHCGESKADVISVLPLAVYHATLSLNGWDFCFAAVKIYGGLSSSCFI